MAASHIMGVPTKSLDHDDIDNTDELYDFIIENLERKSLLFSVSPELEENLDYDDSVVSGHAYQILSVHQVTSNGLSIRTLQLRNPAGVGAENDVWSADYEAQIGILKQQLNVQTSDNGIFFIELEDYLDSFSQTTICIDSDS